MSVKVNLQVGLTKNKKKTQSIKSYLNDEELSWTGSTGMFLTSMKDRNYRGMIWYMCSIEVEKEDVIKLAVKTFLTGVGLDHECTFETMYYASEDAPVREVNIKNVGMKGYPLIKGRVLEIGTVSEEDKRKADIDDFMNEGF